MSGPSALAFLWHTRLRVAAKFFPRHRTSEETTRNSLQTAKPEPKQLFGIMVTSMLRKSCSRPNMLTKHGCLLRRRLYHEHNPEEKKRLAMRIVVELKPRSPTRRFCRQALISPLLLISVERPKLLRAIAVGPRNCSAKPNNELVPCLSAGWHIHIEVLFQNPPRILDRVEVL